MNRHSLLALALLTASAWATTPTVTAGTSSTSADDLIQLESGRMSSSRTTEFHLYPDANIVFTEDSELSGLWICDTFEIQDGALIVATNDLTVIARRLISIDGDILGEQLKGAGVSVVLKSFGQLHFDGSIRAGDGLSWTNDPGGDAWIAGERSVVEGDVIAGSAGTTSDHTRGGDGGNTGFFGTITRMPSRETLFLGGSGGPGAPGGDGGNSGMFESYQADLASFYGAPLAITIASFPAAMAAAFDENPEPVDPPQCSTFPAQGAAGDGQNNFNSGKMADGDTVTECCEPGNDGEDADHFNNLGGAGGTGDDGQNSTSPSYPYHGGNGAAGGHGGDATTKSGGHGSDATDCCGPTTECEYPVGKNGGEGGRPGYASGGDGGDGGRPGMGSGSCLDGFGGPPGNAGETTHGVGGNGGNGGSGQLIKGGGGGAGGRNTDHPSYGVGCGTGGMHGGYVDTHAPIKCGEGPNQGKPGAISAPPGTPPTVPGGPPNLDGSPGDQGGICP